MHKVSKWPDTLKNVAANDARFQDIIHQEFIKQMNSLVAEQFNGNYVQIGTSNRMALSAINDKFDEW